MNIHRLPLLGMLLLCLTGCGGGSGGGDSGGGGGSGSATTAAAPTTAAPLAQVATGGPPTTSSAVAPAASPAGSPSANPSGASPGASPPGGAALPGPAGGPPPGGSPGAGGAGPGSTGTTPNATSGSADLAVLVPAFVGNGLSVSTSDTALLVQTPDLPNHPSVYWPTSDSLYQADTNPGFSRAPNSIIVQQSLSFTIPRFPQAASSHSATNLGPFGVARNGVALYNQYAGTGQPLGQEIASFDQYNGHPNPMDQYHYHVEPLYLTQQNGKSSWVGVLLDGFPVYGPEENGKTLTSSDLDAYHGHFTATADFPQGIYHYHVTADAPYINGGQFYGTPGMVTQ